MTQTLPVSVIIVSRDRPDALARCLSGVAQLRHPNFEVIVVTDKAGTERLWGLPEAAHIKKVRFDEPNISAARNLGLAEAAGEVVAFVDDDAVPEPSWLGYLAAPFVNDQVMAAGGYVIGRNGISYQWTAQSVDVTGRAEDIHVDPGRTTLLTPAVDRGIKTQGTNMAFRRGWLAATGGFDPGFRYFLDETDVNLRLAADGHLTAVVPQAIVHHGYAGSAWRRDDRVPRDLFEIGASWAVFLDKHCPPERRGRVLNGVKRSERARAVRHMVAGRLEPRDVRRLMTRFEAGLEAGHARAYRRMAPIPDAETPFLRFPALLDPPSIVLAGRPWSRAARLNDALRERQAGRVVTEITLSPTAWRHKVRFGPDGVWHQSGGLFGKSDRSDRAFKWWRFRHRIMREVARVRNVRLIESDSADTFPG